MKTVVRMAQHRAKGHGAAGARKADFSTVQNPVLDKEILQARGSR